MESLAKTKNQSAPAPRITGVGIDVGGIRKGFHAVAIADGNYVSHLATQNVQNLARWCVETVQAQVIAIDAPCCWSMDGYARPAEKQLMRKNISCFSTPTRARAVGHPTDYFSWMLSGEELFLALVERYPLSREWPTDGRNCCFETFPHAITWHLRGGNANATQKRKQRRELLQQSAIDLTHLTSIDFIDAALCALTAYYAVTGRDCIAYGEPNTGLIIVPSHSKP